MKSRPATPRWLLAGLLIVSGVYFMENPAVRFGAPPAGAPLTGMEQLANLLVAATVGTLLFIAIRTIGTAINSRK